MTQQELDAEDLQVGLALTRRFQIQYCGCLTCLDRLRALGASYRVGENK